MKKAAAYKIVITVAIAAAVLVNAVIPVSADDSYNCEVVSLSNYYITNIPVGSSVPQLAGWGFEITGNFNTNTIYSFFIDMTVQTGANAEITDDSSSYGNYISSSKITNLTTDTPYNYIPDENISFNKLSISPNRGIIIIILNTGSLVFEPGYNYFYPLFVRDTYDKVITINSITCTTTQNADGIDLTPINNNLNQVINNLNSITTNQNTTNNNLSQIVTNTQQIEEINTVINQSIQTTNNKLDTTNSHLNQVYNQLLNIYNVGQGNTIPDNATNLDNAQQSLHQAEGALNDKSESLASKASSGINTAKTASTQFISTITPAVSSVTTTVTQAIEALPSEIQPMIYSMPLLSFAVWLIGLKR